MPRFLVSASGLESGQSIDQRELRSILSNLSHEIRRPLISLKSGFDLLLTAPDSSISAEERGHLTTMVTLCDDLLRLTGSYLDYATIVQGGRPVLLGEFTMGALVDEIDRQFAAQAREAGLRFATDVSQPDYRVATDAVRFQQIMGNLVANAIKYTPSGGLVHVIGRPDADGWSIQVEDTGPGIPAEATERVFEPFYRLPCDEHSATEGSGLGLAICRELTAQLRGRIELASVVGQGTCVRVWFPRHSSAGDQVSDSPLPGAVVAPRASAGKRGRAAGKSVMRTGDRPERGS